MKTSQFLCLLLLVFFFFVVSSATACDRCLHKSRATFVNSISAIESGACGYGKFDTKLNGGYTAAAGPSLYKNGAGCGGCFQVRCKNPNLCKKQGTKVVVTDSQGDSNTDFVLSAKAFSDMAKTGMNQSLIKFGVVDVEYKRIPCAYNYRDMAVRVEESSSNPNYLAIKFLYQGGQTDIIAVDVAPIARSSNWISLRRSYGAVWDTTSLPSSAALRFRISVTSGYNTKFYWTGPVLPAFWKNGAVYDTGVQIDDIAQEKCWPCDPSIWN